MTTSYRGQLLKKVQKTEKTEALHCFILSSLKPSISHLYFSAQMT